MSARIHFYYSERESIQLRSERLWPLNSKCHARLTSQTAGMINHFICSAIATSSMWWQDAAGHLRGHGSAQLHTCSKVHLPVLERRQVDLTTGFARSPLSLREPLSFQCKGTSESRFLDDWKLRRQRELCASINSPCHNSRWWDFREKATARMPMRGLSCLAGHHRSRFFFCPARRDFE